MGGTDAAGFIPSAEERRRITFSWKEINSCNIPSCWIEDWEGQNAGSPSYVLKKCGGRIQDPPLG